MFCGQCGKQLESTEARCGNCGKETKRPAASVMPQGSFSTAGGMNGKKILMYAAIVILVLFAAIKLIGGGKADMSSPEATVTGFIKAAKKQDVDRMFNYFAPSTGLSESAKDFAIEQMEDALKENNFKLVDYKILDVEIDKDEATVDYMVKLKYEGETETEEDSFDLIKVGKKWYIDDSFFNM